MRGKNCQKKRAISKKNSFKKPYNNKTPSIKKQIALKKLLEKSLIDECLNQIESIDFLPSTIWLYFVIYSPVLKKAKKKNFEKNKQKQRARKQAKTHTKKEKQKKEKNMVFFVGKKRKKNMLGKNF